MKHDYNSPSTLNLNFHCPGNVNLRRELTGTSEEVKSPEASEGTRKHELTTMEIKNNTSSVDISDDVSFCIQSVAEKNIGAYPVVVHEYRVGLSDIGISGGIVDLLCCNPGASAIFFDYKFGVGYVDSPTYNWQMKAYAYGIFKAFGVKEIEAIILQPNVEEQWRIKSHVFYAEDCAGIGEQIKAIVEAAKKPDAPLSRGRHCVNMFCKVREVCPLWKNAVLEMPQTQTIATYIKSCSPDRRKTIYENLIAAKSWSEKALATMQAMTLNKEVEIAGYEIDEGRKYREWSKPDDELIPAMNEISTILKKNIDPWKPRELLSPAEFEKKAGKSKLVIDMMESLVVIKPGKPIIKESKIEA